MRVLITGYSGFAGSHLTHQLLAETGAQIWGTVYGKRATEGLDDERVHEMPADLRDLAVVREVVEASEPDIVFHLAGEPSVQASWHEPWRTFETNVRMQFNLHQALADRNKPCRLLVVISNEVYGATDEADMPTDERVALDPLNPYAASKAMQDMVASVYGRVHETEVIRLRPFTHIGPWQDDRFVTPSFARQIAEIEAGLREPVVRVGNLSAMRDFSDVRDIVRGYWRAAERGQSGEVYNLGSGRSRSIRDLLDLLLAHASVPVRVEPDPERMRPSDVPQTLCDPTKAQQELGWRTQIPIEQTVSDVLDEWRARVRPDQAMA